MSNISIEIEERSHNGSTDSSMHVLLFDGPKSFWRTGETIQTIIIEHLDIGCVEVISTNLQTGIESNRIYLDSFQLYGGKDEFDSKMVQMRRELAAKNKWGAAPGDQELELLFKREVAVPFVLSRLTIVSSNDLNFTVKLEPQTGDFIIGGRLAMITEAPQDWHYGWVIDTHSCNRRNAGNISEEWSRELGLFRQDSEQLHENCDRAMDLLQKSMLAIPASSRSDSASGSGCSSVQGPGHLSEDGLKGFRHATQAASLTGNYSTVESPTNAVKLKQVNNESVECFGFTKNIDYLSPKDRCNSVDEITAFEFEDGRDGVSDCTCCMPPPDFQNLSERPLTPLDCMMDRMFADFGSELEQQQEQPLSNDSDGSCSFLEELEKFSSDHTVAATATRPAAAATSLLNGHRLSASAGQHTAQRIGAAGASVIRSSSSSSSQKQQHVSARRESSSAFPPAATLSHDIVGHTNHHAPPSMLSAALSKPATVAAKANAALIPHLVTRTSSRAASDQQSQQEQMLYAQRQQKQRPPSRDVARRRASLGSVSLPSETSVLHGNHASASQQSSLFTLNSLHQQQEASSSAAPHAHLPEVVNKHQMKWSDGKSVESYTWYNNISSSAQAYDDNRRGSVMGNKLQTIEEEEQDDATTASATTAAKATAQVHAIRQSRRSSEPLIPKDSIDTTIAIRRSSGGSIEPTAIQPPKRHIPFDGNGPKNFTNTLRSPLTRSVIGALPAATAPASNTNAAGSNIRSRSDHNAAARISISTDSSSSARRASTFDTDTMVTTTRATTRAATTAGVSNSSSRGSSVGGGNPRPAREGVSDSDRNSTLVKRRQGQQQQQQRRRRASAAAVMGTTTGGTTTVAVSAVPAAVNRDQRTVFPLIKSINMGLQRGKLAPPSVEIQGGAREAVADLGGGDIDPDSETDT